MGLSLDAAAAKALVAQVGERQQRLLRELEKLALEGGDDRRAACGRAAVASVGVEEIERRAAHSAEWRAYALADALVGGRRSARRRAPTCACASRASGLPGLTYLMARRLRDALASPLRLRAGESPAEVKRGLRMPARAAERFVADVARSDPERLRGRWACSPTWSWTRAAARSLSAEPRGPLAGLTRTRSRVRAIEAITR